LRKKTFPVTRVLKSDVYGRAACALPNWSPPGVSTGEAFLGVAVAFGASCATGLALRSRSGVQNFSACAWLSLLICGACTASLAGAADASGAETSRAPATRPVAAKVISRRAWVRINPPRSEFEIRAVEPAR